MNVRRSLCTVGWLLVGLVAMPVLPAEPDKSSLSYEQNEERVSFIALVRKARAGDTESTWQVGETYTRLGEPVRALPLLQSAAAAGHPRAAMLLGSMYEEGRGTEKNRQEAVRWYRFAAEQGGPEAMAALGRLMLQEPGAEARKSAWQWLRQSVRLGDRDGQYYLGWLMVQPGAEQDDAQAFQLFASAAASGHVGAQVAAALHLLAGKGVAKDRKAAAQWLDRAAEKQDPVAHFLLGRMAEEDGKVASDAKALRSYRLAAAAGHREAQFALASLLAGSAVAGDRSEAAEWYRKAHEAGHRTAANRLGELYRDEVGERQQLSRARELFQLAADQGNVDAMYNLAQMQNQGHGGIRDTAMALRWYSRAAAAGHERSVEVVDRLLDSSIKTSALGLKGFWQ